MELASDHGQWLRLSEALLDAATPRASPADREAIFGAHASRFYRLDALPCDRPDPTEGDQPT